MKESKKGQSRTSSYLSAIASMLKCKFSTWFCDKYGSTKDHKTLSNLGNFENIEKPRQLF